MSTAVDTVQRFRDLRALVIGDALLDSYLEGAASRLCTEGPVPVVTKRAEHRAPGGAANTAANVRAMGAEVVVLGVTGSDTAGSLLRRALQDLGVEDTWLIEDPFATTLHKMRILADHQYVVRFDEGDTQHCTPETHARLLAYLESELPRCDLVIVSDYGYGVTSDALLERLQALRTRRKLPLLVDAKQIARYARAGATLITPNHMEAKAALGDEPNGKASPSLEEARSLAARLRERFDAEHIALTLAEQGVLLVATDGRVEHVPAHPVPAPREVGAGDSFGAAIALALAAGASCSEAAQIGVDAAGLAVRKHHTAVVGHQELLRRVSLDGYAMVPPLEQLRTQLDQHRLAGRSIVFTNGVFDILHAGHVELLRRAKALGDVLVVAVNSDACTRRLKGPTRPVNNERDRLALVAALDSVDHAILFDDDTPAELIRQLRPDIHVKGGDYAGKELPETDAVREVGARSVLLPLVDGRSTTNVIERILSAAVEDRVGAGA
ncbi:MAG: D-glycero-beta-D-manno-heptose 1-phosphate adenylyltransferase [Chloroflexota bacterium]|nr:D-glycero-beta-D-manno-heptose 1-phosphate adenylyltransferase [Chloroflexota bacterium]